MHFPISKQCLIKIDQVINLNDLHITVSDMMMRQLRCLSRGGGGIMSNVRLIEHHCVFISSFSQSVRA